MSMMREKGHNDGYKVILRPLPEDDGGGWLAEIPDLPGCMSDGETREEALANIEEAKESWIEAQLSRGKPVPPPSRDEPVEYSGRLTLRMPKSLHRRLARKAEREGVSLNQYLLSLISENHVRSTVKHTVEVYQQTDPSVVAISDTRRSDVASLFDALSKEAVAALWGAGFDRAQDNQLFRGLVVSDVSEEH